MSLSIEATIKTPSINLDSITGDISISGISIPENPLEFFKPLDQELETYISKPSPLTNLEFKLEYFNTSSTLIIRNVIRKLASINHQTELKVKWYFENDDEDMQEAGDEFKLLFKDVSFDIIGVNHF
jgi:hypothetical protein